MKLSLVVLAFAIAIAIDIADPTMANFNALRPGPSHFGSDSDPRHQSVLILEPEEQRRSVINLQPFVSKTRNGGGVGGNIETFFRNLGFGTDEVLNAISTGNILGLLVAAPTGLLGGLKAGLERLFGGLDNGLENEDLLGGVVGGLGEGLAEGTTVLNDDAGSVLDRSSKSIL